MRGVRISIQIKKVQNKAINKVSKKNIVKNLPNLIGSEK